MSSPAAQPTTQQDAATAAIVVVLLSGAALSVIEAHLVHLLSHLGIAEPAARNAVALIVPKIEADSRVPLRSAPPRIERVPAADLPQGGFTPPSLRVVPAEPRTPAQTFMRTTEVPRHSRYLVAAARRFEAAQTQEQGQAIMQRERRYLAQHLAAVHSARDAAKRVDQAAASHGPTLGWHSVLDSRTTTECRAANGANFSAHRPPLIGYPGTLHGGTCRYRPGAPHKTTLTVDEATAAVRQHAVIPFATNLSVV